MDNQNSPQEELTQQEAPTPKPPKKPRLLSRIFRPLISWMHILRGSEESLDLLNPQAIEQQQAAAGSTNSSEFEVKRSLHLFFILQLLLVVLFVLWAVYFKVDVSSSATGEVMPSTKVRAIQHLEGGIVGKVLVKEGQQVKEGQALVELSATASGADLEQIQSRLIASKLDLARFEAELNHSDKLAAPNNLKNGHEDEVETAQQLLTARYRKYQSGFDSQKEKIAQQTQENKELTQRLIRMKDQLKLLNEQIKISADLLKENVTSRYNHITLVREGKGLEEQVIQMESDLFKGRSALKEAQSAFQEFVSTHDEEVRQGISKAQREINDYEQQLSKQNDLYQRGVIRSPIDGIVKKLAVSTPGQVIQAGETIMDIVPAHDTLIVSAKLPLADIGYIQPGQLADIRLASADGARFKPLKGKVTYISPDALKNEKDDTSYYEIKITPDQQFFAKDSLKYHLYPGMAVSVAIITGRRTIFDYLLQPMMGNLSSALTER